MESIRTGYTKAGVLRLNEFFLMTGDRENVFGIGARNGGNLMEITELRKIVREEQQQALLEMEQNLIRNLVQELSYTGTVRFWLRVLSILVFACMTLAGLVAATDPTEGAFGAAVAVISFHAAVIASRRLIWGAKINAVIDHGRQT